MHNDKGEFAKNAMRPRPVRAGSSRHVSNIIPLALGVALGLVQSATGQHTRVTELTNIPVTRHHTGRMAFSPDGKVLALPNRAGGQIDLWNVETGKMRQIASPFGLPETRAFDAVFSKDGKFLAAKFEPGGVGIAELDRATKQIQIPVPEPTVLLRMAFLAGTPELVTVTCAVLESGLRRYSSARWNITTGKRTGIHDFYPGLQFETVSPDGAYVLLQNGREQVACDSGSGKQIFAVVDFGESRFSPDCSTLISYDVEGVTQWAVPSGKKLRRIDFPPRRRAPGYDIRDCLAISSNNKLLAIGAFTDVNTVALVSLDSGKVLGTFECCPSTMFCSKICFSPSGRILATDTDPDDMKDQAVEPLLKFWKIPDDW